MRRRTWTYIRQADILISFQMGLPSMIELPPQREDQTSLPRNIYDDEEFGEDCAAPPAALPDNEPTLISFLIAKAKLAFGFARALKEINKAGEYIRQEKILEIDRDLRNIYKNVPEHYKLGQLSCDDARVGHSNELARAKSCQ
jgi:hypothetical protein